MPDYNMLVKVTSQGMDQVSKGLEALGRNIDKAIAQADRLSKSVAGINSSIAKVDFSPMSAPAIPVTTQNTEALETAINRLASEVNKNTEAFGTFSSEMNKVQAEEKEVVTTTQETEASVKSLGSALQGIGDIALGGMLFGFAKNFVTGTIEARKETQAPESEKFILKLWKTEMQSQEGLTFFGFHFPKASSVAV